MYTEKHTSQHTAAHVREHFVQTTAVKTKCVFNLLQNQSDDEGLRDESEAKDAEEVNRPESKTVSPSLHDQTVLIIQPQP